MQGIGTLFNLPGRSARRSRRRRRNNLLSGVKYVSLQQHVVLVCMCCRTGRETWEENPERCSRLSHPSMHPPYRSIRSFKKYRQTPIDRRVPSLGRLTCRCQRSDTKVKPAWLQQQFRPACMCSMQLPLHSGAYPCNMKLLHQCRWLHQYMCRKQVLLSPAAPPASRHAKSSTPVKPTCQQSGCNKTLTTQKRTTMKWREEARQAAEGSHTHPHQHRLRETVWRVHTVHAAISLVSHTLAWSVGCGCCLPAVALTTHATAAAAVVAAHTTQITAAMLWQLHLAASESASVNRGAWSMHVLSASTQTAPPARSVCEAYVRPSTVADTKTEHTSSACRPVSIETHTKPAHSVGSPLPCSSSSVHGCVRVCARQDT